MPKIVKNGLEYSGTPLEEVTAWPPTGDSVQIEQPLMGNTDISEVGDGTVTGAISKLNNGLTNYGTTTDGGWNKLPDGTLMQWGTCKVPSGSYTTVIALHQPFVDTKYSLQITPIQSGTSWNINYSPSTASSFSIGRTPNTSANDYYWFAIGRWK